MISPQTLTRRMLALIVTLAVLQVYAQAALLTGGLNDSAQAAAAQTGRLTTMGNNPITVNGNSVKSGETIFSGQQLQTPDKVGATVQLGPLGHLDIAPNTNLSLTFDMGRINVNVLSGCVTLTAAPGVTGTVTADGKTRQTDPNRGGTIDCSDKGAVAGAAGGGAAGAVGTAGGVGIGAGLSGTAITALGLAVLGSAFTIAIVANRPNPSPVR